MIYPTYEVSFSQQATLFSNFGVISAAPASFSYLNELVIHQMLNQVQMLMILGLP